MLATATSAKFGSARRQAPVRAAKAPRRVCVRPLAYNDHTVTAPAINVEALYARLEARAKAMIALEEQEINTRPKVKFVLPFRVGLGECWKIVGKTPELGNFVPEVAPFMTWNNGDVWTLEVPMRPGRFTYKAVLRKPDGGYVWEEGPDREFEVPYNATARDTLEFKVKPTTPI